MDLYHNDPDKFIDNPEYFSHYICGFLSEHKVTNTQKIIDYIRYAQLYGGSDSHVLTNINMSTYKRYVKCNVQIINTRKYLKKGFGLVIIKIPKTNIIIPLWLSWYIP